jgi:hypothetical protein
MDVILAAYEGTRQEVLLSREQTHGKMMSMEKRVDGRMQSLEHKLDAVLAKLAMLQACEQNATYAEPFTTFDEPYTHPIPDEGILL